ncbi:MAG: hypothetical protein ACUVX8_16425 [Candidatus Zipacnadales bacterium]
MSGRRALLVAGAAVVTCAALIAFFVTGNIAQGPGPAGAPMPDMGAAGSMPPDMMMGGGGVGMPGMGGGGGGQTLQYTETPPPEHLQMTYDEFLAKEGQPRMPIPKAYLVDEKGEPIKRSANQWYQLARIYQEGVTIEVERGEPGGQMAEQMQAELKHIEREHAAIRELYEWALNHCFSAHIGHPVLQTVTSSNSDTATVRLHVVLQSTKDFPARVVKRLQPLSKPGLPWRDSATPGQRSGSVAGRARLDIVTREGGYARPVKLYLDAEAIGLWQELWAGTEVRVSLLDTAQKVIAETTHPAGLNGAICEQMLYPQYCWPHNTVHQMPDISPWGTKLKLFRGATKDLYELKGWLIGGTGGLTFSLPQGVLATLNGAQVEILNEAEGISPILLKKVGG